MVPRIVSMAQLPGYRSGGWPRVRSGRPCGDVGVAAACGFPLAAPSLASDAGVYDASGGPWALIKSSKKSRKGRKKGQGVTNKIH